MDTILSRYNQNYEKKIILTDVEVEAQVIQAADGVQQGHLEIVFY